MFFNELQYELGLFTQITLTLELNALLFLAITVCRFVYMRSFRCGMKQTTQLGITTSVTSHIDVTRRFIPSICLTTTS
jgi:hypothetical protein